MNDIHTQPGTTPASLRQIGAIRQRLHGLGASPSHMHRVLRLWSQALPQDSGGRAIETFLPARLRAALPVLEGELGAIARVRSVHPAADGAERLLVELSDGQTVESVLLPRDGLCISSQVGCAVGCVFCMTGQDGLQRQVGSAEMVAQVALARQRRPVKKVVFMGMGEPAHNLDNVLEAIDLLGTAGNIGHKNLVLSTVGDARVFEQLPASKVKPALAISLHSTDAARRAALLPRAPHIAPEELVAAADDYARATGYPIQYQWTLIEGVNDTEAEVDGLVRLLTGRYGVLNLIPFNKIDGLDFRRPPAEASAAMAHRLHQLGILTKLRRSAAQDVDGGCGQLRARSGQRRKIVPIRAAA
ncbi:MAG: RNA methyltransferase [Burkholderiales bacterium]|nr:RNA methyltransferase [Burkholderiales bacterium]